MKTIAKLFALFIFGMLFILASCEKSNDDLEKNSLNFNKFNFNALNTRWIYDYDTLSSGYADYYDLDTVVLTNWSGEDISDLTSSVFGRFSYLIDENNFGYIEWGSSQVYKYLLVKSNSQPNDVIINYELGDSTKPFESRIISINESVTVPAGTFSCFKIEEWHGSTLLRTWFINKQIGLVKKIVHARYVASLVKKDVLT